MGLGDIPHILLRISFEYEFSGTMKLEDFLNGTVASFYSYTKEEGEVKHLSEIGISNGLTWDLKKGVMYYIDTLKQTVDEIDYNNGAIGR